MSTFLRIGTLLLFIGLGACLAACVAWGITPQDIVALCRGNPLALQKIRASNADADPTKGPPHGVPAAANAPPAGACDSNEHVLLPDPWATPAQPAPASAVKPAGGQAPASALADQAGPIEPKRLPPVQPDPPAAREPEPKVSQPSDKVAAVQRDSSAPREERREKEDFCSRPPENHEARLISIIQDLVREPRVQPVSARVAEPATDAAIIHKKRGAASVTNVADSLRESAATSQSELGTVGAVAAFSPTAATQQPGAAAASRPSAASQAVQARANTAAAPSNEDASAPPAKADAPPPQPAVRISRAQTKKRTGNVGDGANDFEIFVKDEDIRQVLALIGEAGQLNILPSPSVTGNVSLSLANVGIMEALEAILKSKGLAARREGRFIYVGTPEEFAAHEKRKDRIATRIYRPNYVTATEIKNLLTPLMSPTVGKISITSQSKAGIESNDNQAGGNDLAEREAVLVQDFESVLAQMDQVVLEIDRRPLQVAIEAMILSVKLDDEHQCGVDFHFLRNQGTVRFGLGSPAPDLAGVSFTDGGLKFAYLDANIAMFIKALEKIGDTNVISTPRLLTLNKQRAEILIGAELGYVTTTVTETTATQSIDFLSVGTQLRLRPFIASDGMIRMEIHPELSTGQVRIEGGLTLPDKEVTKVTTNIMVRDGSTVIIGGLMREDLTKNGSHVPFFGSLPTIGGLFGSKDEKTERREILVLVTPQIVCDDEMHAEGEESACEFHRRQNQFSDSMSPLSRSALGRKYFRLAQEAWAVGNRERARRYINLSIHINPSDRAAIDLRTDIMAGVRHGPRSLYGPLPGGLLGGPAPMPAPVDEPSFYLNEEAIDAVSRGVPTPAEPVPSGRDQPFDAPAPAAPVPNSSNSPTAPSAKSQAPRKPVFPVRAGRKP